jgi:hypothetical protein
MLYDEDRDTIAQDQSKHIIAKPAKTDSAEQQVSAK